MAINTNMCLFLICIILQTGVLVVLFKPDKNAIGTTSSPASLHDILQLQHTINQLSHNLNTSIFANQQQNTNELQSVKQRLGDILLDLQSNNISPDGNSMQIIQPSYSELIRNLSQILDSAQQFNSQELTAIHEAINKISTNSQNQTGPVQTQAAPHIKDTHPGLMRYRYALADAESNPGAARGTTMQPNVVLLEENGLKYWGWNYDVMVNWVYDESGGSGEYLVREVFRKVLARSEGQSPPNVVLDVGSNTGLFSMIAGVYNTKRIYAFDPQPLCIRYIAESAKVNGFDNRIAAINAFVGQDETHVAPIPSDTCNGGFKLPSKRDNVEIHSVNLDNYFLTDPDEIDLVKIDVEGVEIIVLQGAQEIFKKHRVRTLVIEITSGWWSIFGIDYDTGAGLIKELLVDSGYKMWVMPMDKNPPTKLNSWEELDAVMRPPPGYHNQKNYVFSLDDVYE